MSDREDIRDNRNAINEMISNAKDIEGLVPFSGIINILDKIAFQRNLNSETVSITISQLINMIQVGGEVLIDGYWVDKKGNSDVENIEVGDQIRGNSAANKYIIADVIGLPYTDPGNLELYLDNEK